MLQRLDVCDCHDGGQDLLAGALSEGEHGIARGTPLGVFISVNETFWSALETFSPSRPFSPQPIFGDNRPAASADAGQQVTVSFGPACPSILGNAPGRHDATTANRPFHPRQTAVAIVSSHKGSARNGHHGRDKTRALAMSLSV